MAPITIVDETGGGSTTGSITFGNVTSPGADKIRDDLAKGLSIPAEAMTSNIPLGRQGMPADIAELVGFLASDRAALITGSNFIVDGGESSFVV